MQKIDDCKEIRLALTRAGIATCPEKSLQTDLPPCCHGTIYLSQSAGFSRCNFFFFFFFVVDAVACVNEARNLEASRLWTALQKGTWL
jgi:hypothetical protein